ncbi:MAG: glycosyltransferase [Bacteroidetes bacterium]|nr:glycosyltransferase [Bacteroidota bacterium]
MERFISSRGVLFLRIKYSGKADIGKAFFKIYKFLKKNKTDIVHTHLFHASLSGLMAARAAGIKHRIHSRHHTTYNHDYFPNTVKYDKMVNSVSTRILAVSETVKKVLVEKENVNPDKVIVINHGFNLSDFEDVDKARVSVLEKRYKSNGKDPVLGVISRYTHWKGIQHIIAAFKILLKEYSSAYLILANAKGDYEKELQSLLSELPPDNYIEIEFE